MMSASEGEGGSWKSSCRNGNYWNFIVCKRSIGGHEGRGKKSENLAEIIPGSSLENEGSGIEVHFQLQCKLPLSGDTVVIMNE